MKEKFSEKGRNPYDGLRPYSALTHAVGILFALAALAILLHMTISMGCGCGDHYGGFRLCREYAVFIYGKHRLS